MSFWRLEAALALAAALLVAALLALGFNFAWPLTLDLGAGARDTRFAAGFYEPEQFGPASARWTSGSASIALPQLPANSAATLELRLLQGRPVGQPDARVALSAAGQRLGEFDIPTAARGAQIERVLLPPSQRLDWAARVDISSSTFTPPGDPRALGVVIDQVTVVPSGAGWLLPSFWLLAVGACIGGLGYGLLRSVGVDRALVCVAIACLGALLAWGVALRPLEVLPFVHRVAALFGLGLAGVWLARALAPATDDGRRTTDDGQQAMNRSSAERSSAVGGRRSITGSDLPLYLAIAWWLGPLFQAIMTADGAWNVSPPPQTIWIGAGVLLALGGLGLWYAVSGRALGREQSRWIVARAALAIFAAGALAHLAYMIWFAFTREGPDFWILFKGARDWANGGSLYNIADVLANHFGHVFKVPPFYGMLFVPFVSMDGERVLMFHRILNTILLGAAALAWFRMWGLRVFSAAGAGALILLNFRPIADTIAFGQIDVALLVCLTLALWALRRERDLLAGALVALGTLFKIYPVILLAFFVAKRRWRGLAGFALGMAVLNALAIAVMGWEMHRVYLTQVLPNIGGTTSWVENQTISGFLARFFAAPTESDIFAGRALPRVGLLVSALVSLLGCVLALQPARPARARFALQYGQFALLMVLAVPAAWMHYETLLFIPFGALLLHERDRVVSLPRAAALALSFALIGYGNPWSYYDGTVMGVLTVAGVSYKFYGMLLLGAVLVAELWPGWRALVADVAAFLGLRRAAPGAAPAPEPARGGD